MTETREPIVSGSKIALLITVIGLPDGIDCDESDVDITLYFYVKNKRSVKEVTVEKSALIDPGDEVENAYWLILDTTDLPEGVLMCEGKVTYPFDDDNKVIDMPFFDTLCDIVINK